MVDCVSYILPSDTPLNTTIDTCNLELELDALIYLHCVQYICKMATVAMLFNGLEVLAAVGSVHLHTLGL